MQKNNPRAIAPSGVKNEVETVKKFPPNFPFVWLIFRSNCMTDNDEDNLSLNTHKKKAKIARAIPMNWI